MTDTAFDQQAAADFAAQVVSSIYSGLGDRVQPGELARTIKEVGGAFRDLQVGGVSTEAAIGADDVEKPTKAQINKSITPDAIISFIDGKGYRTLRRHIAKHGHTDKSYRDAFGLPPEYPMVAPSYSKQRSEMAKNIGLGQARKKN